MSRIISERGIVLILIGLLIAGIAVRLYHFASWPVALYWDEVAIVMDARSISQTGMDVHNHSWLQTIFPSYGDYKAPVYIWFAGLVAHLTDSETLIARIPSLLAGLLTLLAMSCLAREIGLRLQIRSSRLLILTTLTITSVSYWAIFFSKVGFESHLGQLWILCTVTALLFAQRKPLAWPLVGIFGVLAMYTYYATRFVWPVVFMYVAVWTVYSIIKEKRNAKKSRSIVFSIFGMIATLSIFMMGLVVMTQSKYYAASQQFRLSAASVLDISQYVERTAQVDFAPLKVLQVRDLLAHGLSHLAPSYLFMTGDANLRHGTGLFGLFPLVWLPILILGMVFIVQKNQVLAGLLAVWIAAGILPASVPFDVPHTLRSLSALPAFTMLIALGFFALLSAKKPNKRWAGVLFLLGTSLCLFRFTYHLMFLYPVQASEWWQSGYRNLATQLLSYKTNSESIYVDIDDVRFNLWLATDERVSSSYLQQLKKEAFILQQPLGITITSLTDNRIATLPKGSIVAMKASNLPNVLSSTGRTTIGEELVYDELQRPIFSIARLANDPIVTTQ